jgi:hypothetical protein
MLYIIGKLSDSYCFRTNILLVPGSSDLMVLSRKHATELCSCSLGFCGKNDNTGLVGTID